MDDVRQRVTRWMEQAPRLLEMVGQGHEDGHAGKPAQTADAAAPARSSGSTPRRILLVDDDKNLSRVIVEYLTEFRGHAVRAVASGEEALAALEHERPDIVLLDVMMPGIGGMETLARMKVLAPELPVLMVTASDDAALTRKALSLGAAGYVTKPFHLDDLEAVVRMHLEPRGPAAGSM